MRHTDGRGNGPQSTRSLALLSAVVTPRISAETPPSGVPALGARAIRVAAITTRDLNSAIDQGVTHKIATGDSNLIMSALAWPKATPEWDYRAAGAIGVKEQMFGADKQVSGRGQGDQEALKPGKRAF
jgi:hypothetical protein